MPGFNASRFRQVFSPGFAKKNQFKVQILGKPLFEIGNLQILGGPLGGPLGQATSALMEFYCDAAELPGRTVGTTEFKAYGPPSKIPYGSIYNEVSLSFLCDSLMSQKRYFDAWHDLIIDNEGGHDVSYLANVSSNVRIHQMNDAGVSVYVVELQEAIPVSVAGMPLNWGDGDDVHRMNVDFAYRDWRRIV